MATARRCGTISGARGEGVVLILLPINFVWDSSKSVNHNISWSLQDTRTGNSGLQFHLGVTRFVNSLQVATVKAENISRHLLESSISSKNDADFGAGSSDGRKPMLPTALVVCETFGPYIPALNSYWKGSFTLPHGHGNFDNIFLAHPPSMVHNKVYETIVKMPEEICFELAPNHDVYMELFSGSLPDKDDIGLYFFPSFSHRIMATSDVPEIT
ncbi:hypothetical protein Tco_0454667 [Tanacetum coccineum]